MRRRLLGWVLVGLMLLPGGLRSEPAWSLDELARRAETELRENILPFWLEELPHPSRGGFYGEVRATSEPRPEAPRAALLTSRILWTFSAATRAYAEPAYRAMADRAYEDLVDNFHDPAHGGFFWSLQPDGRPLADFKHVYGQVFALYGLTEYYRATGREEARRHAQDLFRLLEEKARDREHGGYNEVFDRAWQPPPPGTRTVIGPAGAKSQNTHLHIMEAYTNLLRVWPDPAVQQAQQSLIAVLLEHVVDPRSAHLGLFFTPDWTPRSEEVSYGHDIEFAWLLTEAAEVLGDAALLERVKPLAVRIADVTLEEGVEPDGAIPYEAGPEGVTNPQREWWVPAEATVGFVNAYQLSGDKRFLQAANQQWAYIERHFVDRAGGEWFHSITPDGRVVPGRAKASAWKCPYHNSRACLEIVKRAEAGRAP